MKWHDQEWPSSELNAAPVGGGILGDESDGCTTSGGLEWSTFTFYIYWATMGLPGMPWCWLIIMLTITLTTTTTSTIILTITTTVYMQLAGCIWWQKSCCRNCCLFSLQHPLFCYCVPGVFFPGLKNKSLFPSNYHTVQRLGFKKKKKNSELYRIKHTLWCVQWTLIPLASLSLL